jgi:hypothetical protein
MFETTICLLAWRPEGSVRWCYVLPDWGFERNWGADKNFRVGSMEAQSKSV